MALLGHARARASGAPKAPSQTHGFSCLLDEQPTFLVPQRLLRLQPPAQGPAVLNPHCWFSWNGTPPANIAPWLEIFGLEILGPAGDVGDAAWVSDPITGALLPFWLGPHLRRTLEDAAPGEPLAREPGSRLRDVLRRARILVVAGDEARRAAEWEAAVESARAHYSRGYAPLAGLIHPYHVGAMRGYFRRQIRTGAFPLGDDQSSLRHFAHNEPVARFFHHQLAGAMSQVAGQPVKPSYVYFASYQGGAELEKHTDRAQCEFSITFCLDYTPEPVSATDWPIHLSTPQGTVTVYQAIGDALLYRGCEVPHYRKRLRRDATSSSLFLHYVPRDFAGPLG
jgi:hypothetical protein